MSSSIAQIKRKNLHITVKKIMDYFQVSENCAQYMYYRAYRSKYKGPKYLAWPAKLQYALIKADRAYGFNWANLQFGHEEEMLAKFGITFDDSLPQDRKKDEWQVISNNVLIKRCGLLPY